MPDAIKRVGKWVGKRLRRKGKGEGETASQDPETPEEAEEEEATADPIIVSEQEGETTISPRHEEGCDVALGSKEPVASLTADPKKGNEAVEKALKHALSKQGLNSNIAANDVDAIPFDWKKLANREASECQKAKQVKMQEIDKNDIIILIMGPTGVGKSSFVQAAEQAFQGSISEDRHTIGHSLDSGTKNVECLSIEIPNTASKLILVDTPGFDDRERPDSEILSIIGKWLKETYSQQKQINGIVYLHRIQDVRFDAGVATTLSIFQKLCGGGPVYGRVVFTTSGWNNVQKSDWPKHEGKEKELMDGPWKPMLIRSTDAATTSRFDATDEETEKNTVMRTLWTLVKSVNKTVLLLQKELVDQKLSLPGTTAGKAVFTTEEKIRYQLVQLAGLLQPSKD